MDLENIAQIFKRLSSTRRVKILRILIDAEAPLPSSTIAVVAAMSEAQASYNLVRMMDAGIVERIKSGRWSFYKISPVTLALLQNFWLTSKLSLEISEVENEGGT